MVMGSDFGRTPFYNSNRGKDNWNVTSIMAMGAGVPSDLDSRFGIQAPLLTLFA